MIYLLLKPYINQYHIANLFHYITFRSIIVIIFSFIFSIVLGPKFISRLRTLQKGGQPIRELGPESHKSKAGTPTMGGLLILSAVFISTFLFADISNTYIILLLFVLLSLGALGFADDYAKVVKKNHHGVSAKVKLICQLAISVPVCFVISSIAAPEHATSLSFPFVKNFLLDLGYFYVPFTAFVIIGSSNAVNLTDGLDGLAIVPISICAGCFGLISYLVGNIIYANYLQVIFVPHIAEITIFCAALIGAGMGFLWFNAQPADIFMGDTASLPLGGVLGAISVMTKQEIVLSIIGGVFVMETLSVIIQVYYFKATGGKRFFKMAPIHHHFEKSGWMESKVVVRFWILSLIFALIGLSSLKLR